MRILVKLPQSLSMEATGFDPFTAFDKFDKVNTYLKDNNININVKTYNIDNMALNAANDLGSEFKDAFSDGFVDPRYVNDRVRDYAGFGSGYRQRHGGKAEDDLSWLNDFDPSKGQQYGDLLKEILGGQGGKDAQPESSRIKRKIKIFLLKLVSPTRWLQLLGKLLVLLFKGTWWLTKKVAKYGGPAVYRGARVVGALTHRGFKLAMPHVTQGIKRAFGKKPITPVVKPSDSIARPTPKVDNDFNLDDLVVDL
jgi:hypothetical protein